VIVRGILAVLGALIANVLIVSLCEMGLGRAFPPPPGVNLQDPAALKAFAESMPTAALVMLVAGWAAGAFGSAATGYLIARKTWAAWVGPAFNLLGVVMSVAMIPHPPWVAAIGVVMPVLAGWSVPKLLGQKRAAAG